MDHLTLWNLEQWGPLRFIWFSPGIIPSQLFLLLGGILLGGCLCQWIPLRQRKFIFWLFTFSYLSRTIVSYILYLLSCFTERPGTFLGADDFSYMYNGLGLSRFQDADVPVDVSGLGIYLSSSGALDDSFGILKNVPYITYNAFLFQWLGNHPLSVLVTNCLMGTLLIFPLFFLGKELFNSRSGKIAAVCGVFYPSVFLWSTQDLKEPLINLLTVLLFLAFVHFRKTCNAISLVFIGITAYFIGLLRPPIHWLLIGGLFSGWIISSRKVLAAVIVTVSFVCFLHPDLIREKREKLSRYVLSTISVGQDDVQRTMALTRGEKFSLMGRINQLRQERVQGTTFLPDIGLDKWGNISYLWLVPLFITLTVPYPWQMTKLMLAFGAIEMMLWYCLIPATLWGIGYSMRKQSSLTLSLLIPIVIYAVLVGFLDANIGLLVRQRGIVFLNLFVFTGAGFVYRKTKLGKVSLRSESG